LTQSNHKSRSQGYWLQGVRQNFESLFFAANNANFHELIKENPRKSAKSAAKVFGFPKKLKPFPVCVGELKSRARNAERGSLL